MLPPLEDGFTVVVMADQHDAFEQNLQQLGYEPLPDFAVLDECEFYDKKTNQHVRLDRNRLTKMAASQNKRIEGRNAATPVIVGHTKDGVPENQQPEIVGVATRFRVDNLPDGTAAIFARPWAQPGQAKTFRENFRRSVELWLDPDAIDPIAILGPTTPRRDLPDHLFSRAETTTSGSVVRFSRTSELGRQPLLFEMREVMAAKTKPVRFEADEDEEKKDGPPKEEGEGEDKKPAPPEGDSPVAPEGEADAGGDGGDPEFDAKLAQSDTLKQIMALLTGIQGEVQKMSPVFAALEQEAMGGGAGGPPGAPPMGDPGMPPGGAAPGGPPPGAAPAPPPGPPGAGGPPPAPERDGPPDKKMSAGSTFGYGNTTMPNQTFERAPYYAPAPVAPVNDPRVIKLERENKEFREVLAAMKLERIETEVDLALKDLAAEGYAVKPEVDRPHLCKLSREKRDEAIQFMRETRAKKDMTPVPGSGRMVIDSAETAMPIQFSRPDGTSGLGGDPNAGATALPDSYEELTKIAGSARRQGLSLRDFDISQLSAAHANNGAVKVR